MLSKLESRVWCISLSLTFYPFYCISMTKIVFVGVHEEYRSTVEKHFSDALMFEEKLQGEALAHACRDAEIVCSPHAIFFPREVLSQIPNLKMLATRSVGYDQIDKEYCKEKGILLSHVPDYGSHIIAEHAFALLLSAVRHIEEGNRRVKSGSFDEHGLRGIALRGKTIGVVGTGKIGRAAARIAIGFGMNVIASDPYPHPELEEMGGSYVSLDELVASSDIITLHAPAMEQTRGMIGSAQFAKMKKGMILINTARGALVDQSALLTALNDGTLSLALLDVLEPEKEYEASKELIDHPHTICTPHTAFYADESMRVMYEDAIASIEQFLRGEQVAHEVT